MTTDWLTTAECAKIVGISASAFRMAAYRDDIPRREATNGKRTLLYFDRADVERWLRQREENKAQLREDIASQQWYTAQQAAEEVGYTSPSSLRYVCEALGITPRVARDARARYYLYSAADVAQIAEHRRRYAGKTRRIETGPKCQRCEIVLAKADAVYALQAQGGLCGFCQWAAVMGKLEPLWRGECAETMALAGIDR